MPTTYNKINLIQGDYIYYYDTSLGAIASRNWDIRGGSPTGATSFAVTVRYAVPNSSGYGVGLTVTDNVDVTDSVFVSNVITVLPEIENFSLAILKDGLPVSSSDMSVALTYQATGTIRPAPTGNYYYQWFIPGTGGTLGFTGSSKTIAQIIKSTSSWLDLTGSEVGAPYSEYTGSARITVTSPLGNVYTGTKAITYNKSGFPESFPSYVPNLTWGSAAYYPGLITSDGYLEYMLNDRTSNYGMPGVGPMIAIWSEQATIDTQSMHSHTEPISVYSESWDFTFSGSIPGQMTGQLVASGSILSLLAGKYTTNPDLYQIPLASSSIWYYQSRYIQGNYMGPGDPGLIGVLNNTIYYADTNSQWQPLLDMLGYGANAVNWGHVYTLGTSILPAWSAYSIGLQFSSGDFASISSKSYDLTGQITPAAIYGLTGGEPYWNVNTNPWFGFNITPRLMGCVLPSNAFAGIILEIYFNFYCSPDGNINNAVLKGTVTFRTGNDPEDGGMSNNGLLYYANDYIAPVDPNTSIPYPIDAEPGSSGFASLMSATFASNNLSPYFTVGATSAYQWRETAYPVLAGPSYATGYSNREYMTSTFVQGVRFAIKDPYITASKGTLPFGLTGPTYLLKVTITDNFSTGFNYVDEGVSPPGASNTKYTAAQWMGLKQNFIANPYQYVNGGTGSRAGIYFNG